MRLLRKGHTNGEIAEVLGISLDGAKFHVAEIISKLGADSREDAVLRWDSRRRVGWPVLPGLAWVKWAGAAAGVVAVTAGIVIWAALLRGGSGNAEGPNETQGNEPAGSATAVPVAVQEPLPKVDGLVACPPPASTGGAPGMVDWIDFVNFAGVHYMGRGGGPGQSVDPRELGAPYGRVEVNVSETAVDAFLERQDCEAAVLPVGEILFRIDGYDPSFRIATSTGKVYEAYSKKNAATAAEFIDIGGKVVNINVSDEDAGLSVDISDATRIRELVAELLASPVDAARGGGREAPVLRLRFDLADGSYFVAALFADENRVWPDIMVPQSLTTTIEAAIGR